MVDDEPRVIEMIGAVLEAQGFDVTLAGSPVAAVRELQASPFAAVVTDVVFDGVDAGQKILAACHDLRPTAIVLLMTGYPAIEGAVQAMRGGAVDYLPKPVDSVVLAATLHRTIRQQQIRSDTLEYTDLVDILSDLVANTIERVDPYTAGHGERTRRYCRVIAERLGLARPTIERLELAAIAHDYGKIYLDDLGFLTKKGPLTAGEYRQVQKHPELGAEMLGRNPYLREVCRYVAEHHERWDGTGYPLRLEGEEITPAGRILCVVEVFDSLSTRRSYKDPWELPKTMDFFESQSGRAFDPAVVDSFLSLLEVHGEEWLAEPQRDRQAAGLTPTS